MQLTSSWVGPSQITIPSHQLHNWLLDTGSLTERLVAQCKKFELILIGQAQAGLSQEEYIQVADSEEPMSEEEWIIREVLLLGDGTPWVFARSVIPVKLWQTDFTDLNTQPLGQRIFNDPKFSRMPFEITQISSSNPFFDKLGVSQARDLWGRRSTFKCEYMNMMVSEVFLPDSPAYWTDNNHSGKR